MTRIGVFDSGVGGFSVLRPLIERYPAVSVLYVADTAHVPYSDKSPDVLEEIVGRILRFFQLEKVDAVVFACNTSSALILPKVKQKAFAPFFGVVEPGVKAALKATRGKGIGVVANAVTAHSGVFRKIIQKESKNILVIEKACPELVSIVENGEHESEKAQRAVRECCTAGLEGKIDTLILGCTHFPFLEESFRRFLPDAKIIDPAESLVEELAVVFPEEPEQVSAGSETRHRLFATKLSPHVSEWAEKVLGWKIKAEFLDLEAFKPWTHEQSLKERSPV